MLIRSLVYVSAPANDPYYYFLINQLAYLFSTSHFGNMKIKARYCLQSGAYSFLENDTLCHSY